MLLYAHTTRGRTTPNFRSPAASASRGSLLGCRTSDSPAPAPTSWVRTCTVTRPLGGSRAHWSLDSAALRCCWRCWSEDNARHSSASEQSSPYLVDHQIGWGTRKNPRFPDSKLQRFRSRTTKAGPGNLLLNKVSRCFWCLLRFGGDKSLHLVSTCYVPGRGLSSFPVLIRLFSPLP